MVVWAGFYLEPLESPALVAAVNKQFAQGDNEQTVSLYEEMIAEQQKSTSKVQCPVSVKQIRLLGILFNTIINSIC